ncbi:hypothetical protein [Ekhidna sp. To15]|uniref:hypothetical protein n=1 Tax=Ekhidna sp. To15 TaxID=3395267 RepID=UPI003F52704B
MKKIKYLFFICAFAITLLASATETDPKKEVDPKERVEQLQNRVQEIWEMDFSEMDKEEKVELKVELKEIKKELKQAGLDSKVSISIGAIIIILLLLILLT